VGKPRAAQRGLSHELEAEPDRVQQAQRPSQIGAGRLAAVRARVEEVEARRVGADLHLGKAEGAYQRGHEREAAGQVAAVEAEALVGVDAVLADGGDEQPGNAGDPAFDEVEAEGLPLVGRSTPMQAVYRMITRVLRNDLTVLILGESGTGKELVAEAIHQLGHRRTGPFVAVNTAAIPADLIESELFGHEKGAFTGAVARRIGKFEEANGGTLFLDELGEMDMRLQAKLLRAIQERVIDRVGGTTPIKIDIRILASTNRELEGEVRAGRFREDLYFRLNVVTVRLPPLRARPLDIDVLAEHFMRKYAEANGTDARAFAPEAMAMLRGHTWRGNVRELENTVHRAVLLAKSPVVGPEAIVLQGATRPEDRPGAPAASGGSAAGGAKAGLVGRTVDDVERELILDTLTHCLGNRTHAANILGISIRTLRNKLKIYNDQGFAPPPPPTGSEPRPAF
jgi:DNA-binding NtrC family response regulator